MRFLNTVLWGYGLWVFMALADTSSDTTSTSSSISTSTSGSHSTTTTQHSTVSEARTPTGPYISYSSTIIVSTATQSSAITTEAIVTTITSGSTTETTTLGSTTIYAYDTIVHSNGTATGTDSTTTQSPSQIIIQGSGSVTTGSSILNGTSNSTFTSTSTSAQPTNTQPCNNYPEFCERKYSNITEVSAHNSPFVRSGSVAANQAYTVTTQLDDGIRMVQGQMHMVNSTPHFCHTSCEVLDAGPITDYLSTVAKWVSSHPYDVVTILLENGDYVPVETYVPFIQSTGLDRFAYIPPVIPMGLGDWPTLANLILTGKRVIFFMDYGANQTAVPWIIDEFASVFETPFDPTDQNFPCTAQRPPGLGPNAAQSFMYLINHNLNYDLSILGDSLLVPNLPLLNVTNNVTGFGSLGLMAHKCDAEWGLPPKFLNVDYYNVGNGSVFEVAALWNNVTYAGTCCGSASSAAWSAIFDPAVTRTALFATMATLLILNFV